MVGTVRSRGEEYLAIVYEGQPACYVASYQVRTLNQNRAGPSRKPHNFVGLVFSLEGAEVEPNTRGPQENEQQTHGQLISMLWPQR
jgi:hypothetical protein